MAQGNAHSNPFVIAALGASAGGLEAFEQYFKHVPSAARHRLRHHPALGPRPCQPCAGVPGQMHAGEKPLRPSNAFRQRVSRQQYRFGDLPKTG